jgi:hypothetical protein
VRWRRDLWGVKGPVSSQIAIVARIGAETAGRSGGRNTTGGEVNLIRGRFNQGAIQEAGGATIA